MSQMIQDHNRRIAYLKLRQRSKSITDDERRELQTSYCLIGDYGVIAMPYPYTTPEEWASHFNANIQVN